MITDWKAEIAIAYCVQQEKQELDTDNLWDYYLPFVASDEAQIADAEHKLGFTIDPSYSRFLRHANGWRDFFQSVDLFGTSELVGGYLMDHANSMLFATDNASLLNLGILNADLLPIAIAKHDRTIFVVVKPHHPCAGQIIWLAGGVIEKFENFDELFLTLVDYNRAEVERLRTASRAKNKS